MIIYLNKSKLESSITKFTMYDDTLNKLKEQYNDSQCKV
jgi:hypothetical protein